MASLTTAATCALLAGALWTLIGWPLAARCFGSRSAAGAAPVLGWAVQSVVALPLLRALGMTRITTWSALLVPAAIALVCVLRQRHSGARSDGVGLSIWALLAALITAGLVLAALLPQQVIGADGMPAVALSGPIFDHAKVAMIDAITRSGLPASNPFFALSDLPDRLFYYYLWHFSAAQWSLALGVSGWNADAALTGFTVFASLTGVMAAASWLAERRSASAWALLLMLTASIRPLLHMIFGDDRASDWTGQPSGFGTWLFQVIWAPQHVQSALTAVVALALLNRVARDVALAPVLVLAALIAASYQSSIWAGGVTLPLAALVVTVVTVLRCDAAIRTRYIAAAMAAGMIAIVVSLPLLIDQAQAGRARADGFPIALVPYPVLGEHTVDGVWRHLLDVPAYLVVFLTIELAAVYPIGFMMLRRLASDRKLPASRRDALAPAAACALASLAVGGLLSSTAALNNDLAWRGVLPAILILTIAAAAGLSRYASDLPRWALVIILAVIAFTAFEGARFIAENLDVRERLSSRSFARAPDLWRAVRANTAIGERVVNNPDDSADATPWPVNIAWALLSNRSSCYAGPDLALAFAPVDKTRRDDIAARYARVFAGMAEPGDVAWIARQSGCAMVVLTADDRAWEHDPFAAEPAFQLVESAAGRWRLYRIRRP